MQLFFVYSDISSVVLLSLNSCCISFWCIYWQSKIRCLLYPCFFATHLISNNNMGLRKGSYFQPVSQRATCQFLIYSNRLHVESRWSIAQYIQQSCIWLDGQRWMKGYLLLPHMKSHYILINHKKTNKKKRYNKHLLLDFSCIVIHGVKSILFDFWRKKNILISDIISQLCIINCCTCFSAPCNSSYIICYFVWFALENITKLFCLKKKSYANDCFKSYFTGWPWC